MLAFFILDLSASFGVLWIFDRLSNNRLYFLNCVFAESRWFRFVFVLDLFNAVPADLVGLQGKFWCKILILLEEFILSFQEQLLPSWIFLFLFRPRFALLLFRRLLLADHWITSVVIAHFSHLQFLQHFIMIGIVDLNFEDIFTIFSGSVGGFVKFGHLEALVLNVFWSSSDSI